MDTIVDCYFFWRVLIFCSSRQLNYWLVNTHLLNNPVAILDVYPRRMKTYIHTETCTQVFIATLFIIAPKLKTTEMYLNSEWWKRNCGTFKPWSNKKATNNFYMQQVGYQGRYTEWKRHYKIFPYLTQVWNWLIL